MGRFQLQRGPLSDLPASLDEGDHYLAIDQTPPQLYVGPEGGGTPESLLGVTPKVYINQLSFAGSGTPLVDDFGDVSTSSPDSGTITITSASTSFDGQTLINVTGTSRTPNPTVTVQGDGSIQVSAGGSSVEQIFVEIRSFK